MVLSLTKVAEHMFLATLVFLYSLISFLMIILFISFSYRSESAPDIHN